MAEAVRVKNEEQGGGSRGNGAASMAMAPVNWGRDRWNHLRQFLHDVRMEVRQVTWPTKSDVRATTAVVIATVAFFALYFLIVDSGMGVVMNKLISYFTKK